jgi:site-specific recombinase XerD
MIHQFFLFPQTQERMREGPLGCYVDNFAALLHEQGYSRKAAARQIRWVADFSRWLYKQGLSAAGLNQQIVVRYLQYRKRRVGLHPCVQPALNRFLNLLRKKGISREEPVTIVKSARQMEEDRFQNYLLNERGLSPHSLRSYLFVIRQFLKERFGEGAIRLARLHAEDITGYVQRRAPSLSPKRKQHLTTALRSFLRYLRHQGDIEADLAACVPAVASWKLSDLPKFMEPHQIQRVLDCCDRQTPQGRRDYAILLLLARLGLRAGEVVALSLDDVRWETSELTVRGKGRRIAHLPLLQDVGRAIVEYLKNGRPSCSTRRLFVRLHAPHDGFANSSAISMLVQYALNRAGLNPPRKGAHVFRHSLATHMLRHGASLGEIGQLLRHRQIDTTAIYAKVDQNALQSLARPWPGGTL